MKNKKILTSSEIAVFCDQTAMILKAGITPAEGMDILLSDVKDSQGRELLAEISASCRAGNSFFTALRSSGVFPDYVLHMVKLGEESGNLDDVMQALSTYYDREDSISESIRGAIRYPLIMILMMILVIFVLLTKVLPIFNQVYIQLGSEMTGLSASLLSLGHRLNRSSIILLVIVLLLAAVFLLASRTRTGRKISGRFLMNFPLTRGFYEDVAAGRFASGLSMTLSSGLDTYSSLDMVSALVAHPKMQKKIELCKKRLENGDSLADALNDSHIFSKLYSRMVAVGFRTGSLDLVMAKISENYEKETEKKLQSIISILEPTLVIILSLIVGLILLSVILPLMGIMSSIG